MFHILGVISGGATISLCGLRAVIRFGTSERQLWAKKAFLSQNENPAPLGAGRCFSIRV